MVNGNTTGDNVSRKLTHSKSQSNLWFSSHFDSKRLFSENFYGNSTFREKNMSNDMSIDDFNMNWTFFMRKIDGIQQNRSYRDALTSRSFSGRRNRNFHNWSLFEQRFNLFSPDKVLKSSKALSSLTCWKNLAKAASQKSSRPGFVEKLSPWSSSRLIKSRGATSTTKTATDVTSISTRKEFRQFSYAS